MSRPTTQSAPASGTTTPAPWIDQTTPSAQAKRAGMAMFLKLPAAAAETPESFRKAVGADIDKKAKAYEDWAGNKAPEAPRSWLDELGRKGREWSKDKPVLGALDSWMFGNGAE